MRPRLSRMTPFLILTLAVFLLGIAPAITSAQTPYVPYFGKNRVKYDKFNWHIYESEHFEIYFYPEIESHLERVTSYLESAYQRISSELKHELPERAKVVLFKTQSEFQQQDISGGELPEGVLAFAEPEVGDGDLVVKLRQGAGGDADEVAGGVGEHGFLKNLDGVGGAGPAGFFVERADDDGVVKAVDEVGVLVVLVEPLAEGDALEGPCAGAA